MLFYGLIVLKAFLGPDQYENLLLLSQICFLVSLNFLSEITIASLEIKIKAFLNGFCKVYGKQYQTINLHEMIHIPQNLRHNGSIYHLSCFGFENFNKLLKYTVHGSNRIDLEIFNRINMYFCSCRGLDLSGDNSLTKLIKNINSSTRLIKPKITLPSNMKIVSKPKKCTDQVNFDFTELFTIPKIFCNDLMVTSSEYDRKFRFQNSFLVNTRHHTWFQVLKIYYYTFNDQEHVIYHGLKGQVKKHQIIYYKMLNGSTLTTLNKLDGYQVGFKVRNKLISVTPNNEELFL